MQYDEIEIRLIEYGTEEYKKELELRDKILRKPLGLSIYDEKLEKEEKDFHIGCFLSGILIGTLILTPLGNDEVKMRQVAVEDNYRGKSIGTKLVIYAEEHSKRLEYKKIILHARKEAVDFYKKLDYSVIGNEFLEVSIPHYEMYKVLI